MNCSVSEQTVQSEFKAALAYLTIVFSAAFLLGTLRVLVPVPRLGELRAILLEIPVVLGISWVACRWAMHQYAIPDAFKSRLAVGGAAFILLMVLEVSFSILVFKQSSAAFFAAFLTPPGATGLLGQIGFALFPLLQRRPTKR
jgi:hypothetical protein